MAEADRRTIDTLNPTPSRVRDNDSAFPGDLTRQQDPARAATGPTQSGMSSPARDGGSRWLEDDEDDDEERGSGLLHYARAGPPCQGPSSRTVPTRLHVSALWRRIGRSTACGKEDERSLTPPSAIGLRSAATAWRWVQSVKAVDRRRLPPRPLARSVGQL